MQGDRIVGKETIPTLLGEKKTVRLLKAILLFNLSVLLIAAGFGLVTDLGFFLPVCTAFVALVLTFYQRGLMIPGIRMEFLLESNFVLAGVTTLLWSVL
jgi:4-hydroxybenzoate polyprenyltransferase